MNIIWRIVMFIGALGYLLVAYDIAVLNEAPSILQRIMIGFACFISFVYLLKDPATSH